MTSYLPMVGRARSAGTLRRIQETWTPSGTARRGTLSRPRMRHAVSCLIAPALSACLVDPQSSAAGKPCPCPDTGYACVEGVCVESVDGGTGGAGQTACLVPAADFRPTWSTPETIRWDWTNLGAQEDFFQYEVVLGETEQDVRAEAGSAEIVGRTKNPELGFYIAPREGGAVPVVSTITDELEPNRAYFAKLVVTDVKGCRFSTDVVQTTTKLAPVGQVVLFDEQLEAETWGAPLALVPGCGFDGGACLQCRARTCLDADADPATWDALRLVQSIDLGAVPESAFVGGQAFLEIRIALAAPTPNFYTEVIFGDHDHDGPGTIRWWGTRRLPVRAQTSPAAYQKIQLPLSGLTEEGGPPLSFADVQAGFDELQIAGDFLDATEVRLDTIAVRW